VNLGSLPADWEWSTLTAVASRQPNAIVDGPFGSSLKLSDYVGTGVPVLQGKNITNDRFRWFDVRFISDAKANELRRSATRVGDILIVKIGSIGYSAVIESLHGFDFAIIPANLAKLTPDPERVDTNYLHHWMRTATVKTYLQSSASKTAQPALSLGKIRELPLPLPPLPEQRRIAAILDQADALRAKRREALAQLDSLTQSIFIEMFGDPRNPKGWDLKSLPEVTDFLEGPGIMAKDFCQAGIPLVRLAGLSGSEVSLRGCNFVAPEMFARKWAHFALNEGDILVLTSATFGNPAVVGKEAAGAIFYTGIIRFKPRFSDLDATYLRHFLASNWFLRQATTLASGAVIKHFGPTHLKQMTAPVPPLSLQQQFAKRAAQVELLRRPFVQAADESDQLFTSLQHRAFAGQLL
jgi:type I restriction enzyme, S subunit